MTRNRVRHWAEQRGWNLKELWRQVLNALEDENVSQSTMERLYRYPEYMGSVKSLEAIARVFKLKYTDMVEDVPESTTP